MITKSPHFWQIAALSGFLMILPERAEAFPFIVATSGLFIMPLILAAIAAIFSSKRLMCAGIVVSLLYLITISFQPTIIRDVQSDDQNRLSHMQGETISYQKKVVMPKAPDYDRSLTYEQALSDKRGRLVFVNSGGLRQQNGIDPYYLTSNRHLFTEDDILVTLDEFLGETLATVTGLRWVRGGLEGYLEELSYTYVKENSMAPTSCTQQECSIIGLFGRASHPIFSGFSYKKMAHAAPIEEILLPEYDDIEIIKALSKKGPILIEIYGVEHSKMDAGILAYLAKNKIHNVLIQHFQDPEKNPQMMSELSRDYLTSLGNIHPESLAFLCKNNVKLIMSSSKFADTTALQSGFYKNVCNVEFIPVEGMMPQDVQRYVDDNPFSKDYRYIGIYSDKLSAFYTMMASDFIKESGVNVLGISAINRSMEDYDAPVRQWLDSRYMGASIFLESKFKDKSGMIAFALYSIAFFALGLIFSLTQSRLMSCVLIGSQYALLVAALFICTFHHQGDTYPILIVSLLLSVLQFSLQLRRSSSIKFTKLSGLKRLKALGLQVPLSNQLKRISHAKIVNLITQSSEPLIFRSNEMSLENNGASHSGFFTSVVAPDASYANKVMAAWDEMRSYGKPGFIVQTHYSFTVAGAVSSSTTPDGQSILIIESSPKIEGITDNRDPFFKRQMITVEQAAISEDPLARESFKIWQAMDSHFVAEFGIKDGDVIWLQLMCIGDPLLALKNPSHNGYHHSSLNDEVDEVDPWILRELDRHVPALSYRVFGERLFEKPTSIASIWHWMSKLMPWSWLLFLSQRILSMSLSVCRYRWVSSCYLFTAFFLSMAGVRKAGSLHTCFKAMPDELAPVLSEIESPFKSARALGRLDIESLPRVFRYESDQPALSSLVVRERCRAAITILLAHRYQHHGGNIKPLSEPVTPSDDLILVKRSRELNGIILHESQWVDICEGRLESPTGYSTVILTKPDMAIFARHDLVGECHVNSPVSFNSHFAQRCRSIGIGLKIVNNQRNNETINATM